MMGVFILAPDVLVVESFLYSVDVELNVLLRSRHIVESIDADVKSAPFFDFLSSVNMSE